MAERLMPNPEPQTARAFPLTGGFDELLARLLRRAPDAETTAIGPIVMAPSGDPEEEADEVVDEDLDDDDDDLDDDEDDEEFEEDDTDDDEVDPAGETEEDV